MRHYPFPYTKALYPRIVAWTTRSPPSGTISVHRGDLYFNTSTNGAESWLPKTWLLTPEAGTTIFSTLANVFQQVGNTYYLLAGRYRRMRWADRPI
ncbi:MAG: hypothetical protein R3F37_18020 [Candidatus Competibacteraceae bacterium]